MEKIDLKCDFQNRILKKGIICYLPALTVCLELCQAMDIWTLGNRPRKGGLKWGDGLLQKGGVPGAGFSFWKHFVGGTKSSM